MGFEFYFVFCRLGGDTDIACIKKRGHKFCLHEKKRLSKSLGIDVLDLGAV